MLGTGSGTFGAPVNAVVGQNVYSVAAADFDKDGKMDLIAGTNFGIAVKLGNGDGTFGASSWPWAPAGAIGLYPIDLNGDKKIDVIAVNYNASDVQTAITVLLNTTTAIGNPTFAFPPRRYGSRRSTTLMPVSNMSSSVDCSSNRGAGR